eukprot:CAMPEP_0172632258 /NCGR_PEP_ID=MMETSP1068-20121228/183504_1 /TAXON_ID=35684 /ORGANISM="Pseudopedinella elastica, Strain CCMP716" /LENGTH=51 /DNA_ID=CAMNT_0013443607 /DNA_START=117 /DNA_END=269 /DNA_ORIENTATION=+
MPAKTKAKAGSSKDKKAEEKPKQDEVDWSSLSGGDGYIDSADQGLIDRVLV